MSACSHLLYPLRFHARTVIAAFIGAAWYLCVSIRCDDTSLFLKPHRYRLAFGPDIVWDKKVR